MQFNSYLFILVFLPAVLAGYFLLIRLRGRTAVLGWLLLASIAFYAHASLVSLSIIIPSILLDYLIALSLLRTPLSREWQRTVLFALGITANVVFLSYFKYKNFFLETTNTLLGTSFALAPLLLPLGISFITFQKIAFLADVRSGEVKSVRLIEFLFFTLFFPRIVAGPIVRYGEIIPQIADAKPRDTTADLAIGVCLFSIGLFKKVIVADGIARFVPLAFAPAVWLDQTPSMLHAWAGALAYTFQLYFDFSGYSDMALGVARMFGVRLPMNFNSPLRASSIVEFWNRWHITLTRFLTAYIYTPIVLLLTRSRLAKGKPILRGKSTTLSAMAILVGLPTLITMTLSGLWHGAGWQFVFWGVLHGVYLSINQCWRMLRPRFWRDQASYDRVMKPVGFLLTFVAVVIALVFFRANSVTAALSILGGMAGLNGVLPRDLRILRELNVDLSPDLLAFYQPIEPFVWVFGLLLAVTWLPNSLELLQRFQPALDFSPGQQQADARRSMQSGAHGDALAVGSASLADKLRTMGTALSQLRLTGVSLNHFTAMLTAILCALGIMALTRSGTFVYGQF